MPFNVQNKLAQISDQCASLLKEAVFNTVTSTVNIRKGTPTKIPTTTNTSEGQTGVDSSCEISEDKFPVVPDIPVVM